MTDNTETMDEELKVPKGSNKLVLVLIIIIVIGGGVIGYLLLGTAQKSGDDPANPATEATALAAKNGPLMPLDSFIVNLADQDITRYLKTSITVELGWEGLQESIKKQDPILRDAVITLIGSTTFQQIRTSAGKKSLREELVKKMSEIVGPDKIRRVYFTEFVVQ